MKGQRTFTRAQRVQIATLLINAAKLSSTATTGASSAAKGQLAHGLAILTDGKHDGKSVLYIAGLEDALKDQSTADVAALAAAWELEVWPQPVPANKKEKGDDPAPETDKAPKAKVKTELVGVQA